MTIAQGIKRLGTPIAAFLGVVVIGLAAVSWLTDRAAVLRAVENQLRAATGLDLVVGGEATVSLFPGSYVILRNVGLRGNGGEPPLSVGSLTANLRLVPLLMRRFEIADVTLDQPRIVVMRSDDGRSNWTPIIETLTRTIKPGVDSPVSFSEIRVKDGFLVYRDDGRQVRETVSGADMSFAWPSISRSFAATGQFDWRGERIDGSVSINDFIAALSGERSGLKARIAGRLLKFAFDGAVADRASLMMEGTLTADSSSLREALHWIGHDVPGDSGFGRFALKARANLVGPSVALTNVNMEIDGNVTEGVLTYSNDTRQTLQATLASETLDISPYVSTMRLLASGARDWNRQTFDLRSLASTDLDVRLSAAKVVAGSLRFGRTAIGANLRNGTLALSVGEAQVFGGVLRGSFGLSRADANASIKSQFQFMDVDLEAFAGEVFGNRKLAGRGNLNVALEAAGSSAYELTQSLDGTVALTGHDGALIGFNVEQLLRRLERRPLSGAGEFRSGRTPFSLLNVTLKFDNGIATLEDTRIEGPSARLTLSGTASVPAREYDLKGVASLVSAPNTPPAFELPFVVQGPWDDPLIFPDSDALIRRSPASAPLLNAVRDSRTRDAVRSVIDRFKGGPKPAPEAAAVPPDSPSPAAAETPAKDPAAPTTHAN
nr:MULTISPECIES: AsmA family protein [unclassified Bradyrhizobium]